MASSSMLVLLVSACLMAQSMAYFYGGLGGGYYGYGLGGGFGLGYGGYGGMWGMPYGGYGLGLGILRLRLGRRIRSGIRRLRWYVGNALRRLRTRTWNGLRLRTRTRSGHCPSYRSRHALHGWYWQSLLSHHHIRLLG